MLGTWEIKNLAAEDLRTRAVLPTFKEQIAPPLYKLAQGAGEDEMSPKSLCKSQHIKTCQQWQDRKENIGQPYL